MLSVYIVCLIAGGIVLGASIVGGHGHGDADGNADLAGDGDADVQAAGDGAHDGHGSHGWAERLPFLSLRFWTWAATFFGLTGVALSATATWPTTALLVSVATGIGTGWVATYVISKLTDAPVGVLPDANSHIGCEGHLLLPLTPGEPSKVRLRVGGSDVDLVAEGTGKTPLSAGTPVWVVGLRGTHALVEACPVTVDEDRKEKP